MYLVLDFPPLIIKPGLRLKMANLIGTMKNEKSTEEEFILKNIGKDQNEK